MTLRVVIADDEAVARSRLRRLLSAHDDVTIAAEAADGRSTVDAIVRHKPDIVFLDIRMPELDGFEVLEELGPGETPAIVFVTAFSDHAAKAFDVNALDYLLKPYDPQRLAETLDRARGRRENGDDGGRRLLAAVEELDEGAARAAPHRVVPRRADERQPPGADSGAPPTRTNSRFDAGARCVRLARRGGLH